MKKREDNIIWKGLVKFERLVLIITGISLTLVVGGAMILRETVGVNFIGFEEILIMVAFWMYMIGQAHGSYEKSQITADILATMMPPSLGKDIITLIKSILYFALVIVFTAWAGQLALWAINMGTVTPVFRVPMWIGQGSIFVGMLLTTMYSGVYLYDDIKAFVNRGKNKTLAENDLSEAKGV